MVFNVHEELDPSQWKAEIETSILIFQENLCTLSPKVWLNSPSSGSILHVLYEGLFPQSLDFCLFGWLGCGLAVSLSLRGEVDDVAKSSLFRKPK